MILHALKWYYGLTQSCNLCVRNNQLPGHCIDPPAQAPAPAPLHNAALLFLTKQISPT